MTRRFRLVRDPQKQTLLQIFLILVSTRFATVKMLDLKQRALNIQEAEALARNAPKPVVYDFEPVEIPAEYGGKSEFYVQTKTLVLE
jgi:hypothetical protein